MSGVSVLGNSCEVMTASCQHPLDHGKSKRIPEKQSASASLTMLNPLTVWITTNWKNHKAMGIPDHFTCLLRNLHAGEEATVRKGHRTIDWFPVGRGVHQVSILSPYLFASCMQNTSCEMPGWMKHKLESRLLGEISITSDM